MGSAAGGLNAVQRVEATGIPDVGQALGEHPDEQCPIISKAEVGGNVTGELRFTSALGG